MTVHAHAEQRIYVLDLAAVPSDFDRVANCSLDFTRGGRKAFGNLGIEALCDAVNDVGVINCHFDRFAQELISLYVRGYPDGYKDIRDLFVERFIDGSAYGA